MVIKDHIVTSGHKRSKSHKVLKSCRSKKMGITHM